LISELKALSWINENYPKCVNASTEMLRIFIKQISGTSGGKILSRARHIRLSPTIMKIFERGFSLGKYNVSRFIGNVFCREYLKAPVQWHFHQLRHTFGFHHLSAGEPLEVVSDMSLRP